MKSVNAVLAGLMKNSACSISKNNAGLSIGIINDRWHFIRTNNDDLFITSYSYSKGDPTTFATESWSFQKWVDAAPPGHTPDPINDDILYTGAPDYTIQGITEGNYSGDVTDLGLVLDADGQVNGTQGSVTAGFPGIGNADVITYGIATQIGGGTLFESGRIGNSSASIPHSPLYVGTT